MRSLVSGGAPRSPIVLLPLLLLALLLHVPSGPQPSAVAQSLAAECRDWQSLHPEWIFCDDFESDAPMVGSGRYFEYGNDQGDFVVLDDLGYQGSRGLRTIFQAGEVGAGGMKLGFGRNPNRYMRRGIREDEDFREVYYRMYLRMQPGWSGNPAKLSRATVFSSADDWSQAMIAHLWGDGADHLLLDPVRCVDSQNRVKCVGYNDFGNMNWLGFKAGVTPIYSGQESGGWRCVEAHVRLNDPNRENGLNEFWIDGQLEVRREGLDFVRGYTDYSINAIFFENYWNAGSPRDQERYFDNIVVSEAPIGCLEAGPVPSATPIPASATPAASATSSAIPTASPEVSPTVLVDSWRVWLPYLSAERRLARPRPPVRSNRVVR